MYIAGRNPQNVFIHLATAIMKDGDTVQARQGVLTKELTGVMVEIEHPCERVICHPHRNNNIFATIAETLWVLGGRNDLKFLSNYLPRAIDFSDDGKTWRGGYGPRLRNFDGKGLDQLEEVLKVLVLDQGSRRAVISIYDPDRDFVETKDTPCNNWLQFIVRFGKVDLHVTQRSCDVLWGFSGINTFEWSVLLECVAGILNVEVGKIKWFIGSAHVYDQHFDRVNKILEANRTFMSLYSFGARHKPAIFPTLGFLDRNLKTFFQEENSIRNGQTQVFSDTSSLIRTALYMMNIYKNIDNKDLVYSCIESMGDTDLTWAVLEYLQRKKNYDLTSVMTDEQEQFLSQFNRE